MTSVLPTPRTTAAEGEPANPNLVKDGGFQDSPNFQAAEYSYHNALARAQNVFLSQWDFGSNGNNLGNDQGPRGQYIDVRSHDYAFDQSPWRDVSHDSNAVDLIGLGDAWHGYVGQHISGLIPGAQYEVTFLAGAAFADDNPHAARMRYTVFDGSSPYGLVPLDKEIVEVRPADLTRVGGAWRRYWEQHKRSFTALTGNAYIKFSDDNQLGFYSGAQLADVAVRLQAAPVPRFTVSSGDAVQLRRGVDTRYPGVRLQAQEEGTISPQIVHVTLPQGRKLRFDSSQLTVYRVDGSSTTHTGTFSQSGQALTFQGVDLALNGRGSGSILWVSVSASADAPLGPTSLTFQVGGTEPWPSSPLEIVAS